MPVISVGPTSNFEATTGTDPNFLTWTVTLDEPAPSALSVDYRFLAGSATVSSSSSSGSDAYEGGLGGTLSFAAGETSKTISIRINGDASPETDEAVVLELFSPAGGAELAGGEPLLRSTGWIRDDDGAGEDRALFVSNPVIVEGNSGTKQAVFEVSLSQAASSALTVNYATVDGTAIAGQDYTGKSGDITFQPGQTTASVAVNILGDTDVEPTEAFTLDVTAPASVATVTDGVGTILSEDVALVTINVTPTAQFEATNGTDPNFLTWTVTLDEPAPSALSVDYRFLAGSATVSSSSSSGSDAYEGGLGGTLSFAAGETSKTISIRINGDASPETDEAVVLELFSPSIGTGLAGGNLTLQSLGWIRDDDGAGADTAIAALDVTTLETVEDDEIYVELQLSRPSDVPVEVSYAVNSGTATAGSDFTAKTGTVTFSAGQTLAAVPVVLLNDTFEEETETFTVSFDGGAVGTALATVTVIDDDDPAIVNAAPNAVADTYVVTGGTTLVVSAVNGLLTNDTDDDGDALSAVLVDGPSQGSVILEGNGSFTYTGSDLSGAGTAFTTDSFTYQSSDGEDSSETTTVSITINPQGDDSDPSDGLPTLRPILDGTNGADTFSGTSEGEVLLGFLGNDNLSGLGGDDTISALAGNNTLVGDGGADVIVGGQDDDILQGGSGDDHIVGDISALQYGNDIIAAGAGDDALQGGLGADTFRFLPNQDTNLIATFELDYTNPGSSTVTGTDFQPGLDVIELAGFGYTSREEALERFVDIDGATAFSDQGTVILLNGISPDELSADDFILAIV